MYRRNILFRLFTVALAMLILPCSGLRLQAEETKQIEALQEIASAEGEFFIKLGCSAAEGIAVFDWLRRLFRPRGSARRGACSWQNDYSDGRVEPDPEFGPYFEARRWLADNVNEAPLASNRFSSRQDAAEFIERMYELGAVRVLVGNVVDEAPDGHYADLLVVEAPFDLSRVHGFLTAWEAEFGRMNDYQGSSTLLYFWWD